MKQQASTFVLESLPITVHALAHEESLATLHLHEALSYTLRIAVNLEF
jgi:hypothetical protein